MMECGLRLLPLVLAVVLLPCCDSPQKRALHELSKAGIQPSAGALLTAVQTQNFQQIDWLLAVGVFTEQLDSQGRTPLRIALEHGDGATVLKLLTAKANPNAITPDRSSLLGAAVSRGQIAITEKLLTAGARVDGLTPEGEKILPWAVRNGRLLAVRALMRAGADPRLTDRDGNPLLLVAMASGRREIFKSLIERGADPNGRDAAGISLLGRATRAGNDAHIESLLESGADPNFPIENQHPLTPLQVASRDHRLFQLFLACDAKPPQGSWTPWLWQALQRRDLPLAQLLLSHGASGLGLVEAASAARSASFVKLLLDYGNSAGRALPQAAARGDLQMVELLLTCGVDSTATLIPTLHTPLGLALLHCQDATAAALLKNTLDAAPHAPLYGQSLFHFAVATGCHRTVQGLLAAGADANESFQSPVSADFYHHLPPGAGRWVLKYDRNITPLMIAVDSGNVLNARYLLEAGAKTQVSTRDSNLWPINFASRRGDVKMMRLLLGKDPAHEERHVIVSLSQQRARVMDAAGKELFSTRVSTGRKGFATPTGEFVITNKYRDWTSTIYHASMPYFQRLSCSDFGLHQGSLPGYPASHGCIRVPAGNAAKLFTLTRAGDRVRILP